MKENVQVLCGDAFERLKEIESDSIPIVVSSPPYDDLRTYGSGFTWDFQRTALELSRVLSPGGVICWNVGDSVVDGSETLTSARQKIFFVEQCKLRCHDTMIWQKLNFANPESARYHNVFEYVFIFSKGKPRTFNPIKDKPNATAGRVGCLGKNTYAQRDGGRSERATTYVTQEFGMRGNVWTGPTRGQEDMCEAKPHPAMMPKWLARDLILSWSNTGDTVLDPFAGSGTTGEEALKLGRDTILIELNPQYVDLIHQRLSNVTPGLPFCQ